VTTAGPVAEHTLRELYETVEQLRRSQDLVTVLQQVAVAANEAVTFEDAAATALTSVCGFTGWPVGHLYLADEVGGMAPTDVWHLDDAARCEPFRVVTMAAPLRIGIGLPGRVLDEGRPVWIPDVTVDPNFPRVTAAVEVGLRAGFAFPVLVGTEVAGVLEFFAHEAVEPNEPLLAVMTNVGSQLGRVVERLRADTALRASEQRTRAVIETANDAFVSVDSSGRIIDWNRQAVACFGWTRDEALGQVATDLMFPAEYRKDHGQAITEFLISGNGSSLGRRVELDALHRDGHEFPIEITPWVMEEAGGLRFNAFVHDITERRAFQRQLEHQSLHDELTGLPNRALLLDRLEHALDLAARVGRVAAVLFIDLDRFKAVNDSFGHHAGDQVLVEVAERISSVLRPGDTVARLSGDEFVALCEDVPGEVAALELAERVLGAIAAPFPLEGGTAHISASVGIAFSGSIPVTPEAILGDADIAMYRAKARGKGVCELFDDSLRVEVTERLALERQLRLGVDREELVAHFQPVFDMRTGAVVGAEALVRWQHPERGLLFPGDFVPVAEESATLVSQLGTWMIREACGQLAVWRAAHRDEQLWVAVNLSVKELEQRHLVRTVSAALAEHELPAEALVFEITETAVMHDTRAVMRNLWALREMGVGLAIDDFGTGWSSLDRLRRMPVQTLKIDRSFIAELDAAPGGTALVAAMIAMSHSLGLDVVAEGVELPAQLNRLRELGCDQVQGYLLGRPASAEAFVAFLDREPVRA
jgi:diguanylate cyclase (GGDEF)-like protein/PAS domain S-box-containing protein